MERPLDIAIRHGLSREEILDLRDEILDVLREKFDIELDATCDGLSVAARHGPSTVSTLKLIGDLIRHDSESNRGIPGSSVE